MAPYRDPDNLNQSPGNWRPQSTGLGGLLQMQPQKPFQMYPGVPQQPQRPSNATSPIAPQHRAPAPRPAAPRPPAPAPVGGGGYGGGGGGGFDGYSAGATPSLASDPAFQAFMRALGFEKNDLNQSAEDRIFAIKNEVARRLGDIGRMSELSREGISGNFEARGLLRSGSHEQTLARQRTEEAAQRSSIEGIAGDQERLIRGELARRLAEIDRRGAEQSLNSAGSIYG